jgi:hypothetical protein
MRKKYYNSTNICTQSVMQFGPRLNEMERKQIKNKKIVFGEAKAPSPVEPTRGRVERTMNKSLQDAAQRIAHATEPARRRSRGRRGGSRWDGREEQARA